MHILKRGSRFLKIMYYNNNIMKIRTFSNVHITRLTMYSEIKTSTIVLFE